MIRPTLTVLGKELRENLRDFHVLAFSLAFPLFFYPALVWGVFQLLGLQVAEAEREPPRLHVEGSTAVLEILLEEPAVSVDGGVAALLDGEVDAVVRVVERGEVLAVTVDQLSTRPRSRRATALVEERLADLEAVRLEDLAAALGLDGEDIRPWEIERDDRSPPVALLSFALSILLPAQLVLVMLIAALYPAVDVVVGERERTCLETTLVAAVPRLAVVAGKALAVGSVVAVALVGNVLALTLTVFHTVYSLGVVDEVVLDVRIGSLALAAPATAATVMLVGSAMVVGVLPARTFKQGELMGTLVALVAFVPALGGIVPDAELSLVTAAVPLTNTVLVAREAIAGRLEVLPAVVAALVNGGLGVLVLWIGARMARSEMFLFGATRPRWLRWLERRDDRG